MIRYFIQHYNKGLPEETLLPKVYMHVLRKTKNKYLADQWEKILRHVYPLLQDSTKELIEIEDISKVLNKAIEKYKIERRAL